MSFILDALRKSEHERERKALPGVAGGAATRPRETGRLPLVLAGLGVLLLVNLVVLLVLVLRRPAAPEPVVASVPTAAVPAATAPAAVPPPAPGAATLPVQAPPVAGVAVPRGARELRPLSDEAAAAAATGFADPLLDAGAPAPAAQQFEAPPARALEPPPVPPRTVQVRPPAASDDGFAAPVPGRTPGGPGVAREGVPSIHDLQPQATAGLPPLNIDLHVYATTAAERFVFLNGRRYREGSQLQEGPVLERITPEGAVLNHRGLRFLLPRD